MMEKQLTIKETNELIKNVYLPPRIDVEIIELEQGIAAGSALINPNGETITVREEWETGTDRDGDFDW